MDKMISAWKGTSNASIPPETLKTMLQEGKHPVLQRTRRQLIFEAIVFSALLIVYYDFFDGDQKPLYLNLLLVAALLFAIGHSIAGYVFSRRKHAGNDLVSSLKASLTSLRTTAILSVTSRVATAVCLLIFFTAQIRFTMAKYWLLAGMITIILVQFGLLAAMWRKRVRGLETSIRQIV